MKLNQNDLIRKAEEPFLKRKLPYFEIGDTVEVHCRILEGEKERIQIFSGVVIARSGSGAREMFTVRRIVQGEGVERKFPLHSPRIARIRVKRAGRVRRAKLYYLRERVGKAVRLKERPMDREKRKARAAKAQGESQLQPDRAEQDQPQDAD